MIFPYRYDLKLKANGVSLPDPSSWNYQIADLDTSGSRDGTGYLHRAYVATKINYEFEWTALEWEMLQRILKAVQKPKFTFSGPDPRDFVDKVYSGTYYVGDRTGEVKYYRPDKPEWAVYSLKVKFIEY